LTGVVPIGTPPLPHVVGAVGEGPNTTNVMPPPAELVTPDRVEVIAPVAIAPFVVAVVGALRSTVELLATAVEVIPVPHPLLAAGLPASPL
jgi:hypothetical protein